ncbi:hypothetical protein HMPREF9999_00643 [Alloprevotella sp. oral taxon 473 str. F0040]|nr:hypothetical protein HMPREF9999_00643 [Alloprevotella sp. oral taxon 473 str. F0040]
MLSLFSKTKKLHQLSYEHTGIAPPPSSLFLLWVSTKGQKFPPCTTHLERLIV